ncbi:MAG TPA: FkbM family methyltransferase [Steroidobacteraceae bacterium]|nr:FkbM family methyltransferase [Steroidobacteraceae bacterium]
MSSVLTRLVQHCRGHSHAQTAARLKALGFTPRVIYDIGAHQGNWTRRARSIYPAAHYILFEANFDNEPALHASGELYYIAALADRDGDRRELYLPREGINTGASFYRERSAHYASDRLRIEMVRTQRLDTLCAQHELPAPDLIKLDVQGAELDVLTGAGGLLRGCGALIVELSFLASNQGAPLAPTVMSAIERLGFQCTDVCKLRRTRTGAVGQIDVLFTNATWYEAFRTGAGLL